jgi:pimeloyl-ACP methyl ester carboxylesterase
MAAHDDLLQAHELQTSKHTISYATAGRSAGITLVFVHTVGGSAHSWIPLIRKLTDQFRIIAVDLPGFGASPPAASVPRIADYAAAVEAVLEHERALQPILVGHGMGSQVIATLITRRHDITSKAVLISPTTSSTQRSMGAHYHQLFTDLLHEPPRVIWAIVRDWTRTTPWRYMQAVAAMNRNRIDGNLAGCQAAVMIIRGANDHIAPHAWAGKLAAIATVAGLFEVKEGRHYVHASHSNEVADIIEGFALS